MTGPAVDAPQSALAPVAAALVERARAHAELVRGEAEREAAAVMRAAERQAAEIIGAARAAGRAEGELQAATERAQARREARAILLGAHSDVYEELRRRVREAVRALRDDPCYPGLLARLTELARDAAHGAASDGVHDGVHDGARGAAPPEPAPCIVEAAEGGIEATAPGLRVDLSADTLADRALDLLGAEVMELWEPER